MRRARRLMVQGTMSNVGKSLLVAGLCRVLKEDGFAVAPFKSQNMALNSGVTAEGLEMGRAQIMQAQAAGVEPSAAMNPILLKPEGERGSQVVVNGVARGSYSARAYFHRRAELAPVIMEAFHTLEDAFDVVLIEGAGSPAEINLKENDIVNMGLARMLDAPVMLVGDIDPGGVFAQVAGTLSLLEPQDRARVRGVVINKFRGDVSILEPGLRQLEGITGVPVMGVVPYLRLDLDDEDSLSARLDVRSGRSPIDVAVIRLPHLSNFTDFDPIDRHGAASVRYVDQAPNLGRPDLVILPGTKRTVADLAWLRDSGLAACVEALAQAYTPILGVCGGFQMLGQRIDDPDGVECRGSWEGLGLLPVHTVFEPAKRLMRTSMRFCPDEAGVFVAWQGLEAQGYEIHAGCSVVAGRPAGEVLGADGTLTPHGASVGNVLGVYLHGLFDAPQMVDALVAELLRRRGLPFHASEVVSAEEHRARQFDELAQAVRTSLDMDAIYAMLDASVGA